MVNNVSKVGQIYHCNNNGGEFYQVKSLVIDQQGKVKDFTVVKVENGEGSIGDIDNWKIGHLEGQSSAAGDILDGGGQNPVSSRSLESGNSKPSFKAARMGAGGTSFVGATDMPSEWQGNVHGIGSYFRANLGSDSTNGTGWAGVPYKDSSPVIAIDMRIMGNGDEKSVTYGSPGYEAAVKKYAGLEVLVTNRANGISKTMYIGDGFDHQWVRSPGSIDIMADSWSELAGGAPANDKTKVLDIEWHFTGNRSAKYSYKGPGD